MKVWIERPHDGHTHTRVVAEFTWDDMVRARLDQVDLAMLQEPIRSGADILLDAELVARRVEQSHTSPEET